MTDREFYQLWISALTPIVSALVSFLIVWITLAYNRGLFYSQKFWERKMEAYADIIRAMADLEYTLEEWDSHFTLSKGLTAADKQKLIRVSQKAATNLKILAGTAPFLITAEAGSLVRKLAYGLDFEDGGGDVVTEIHNGLGAIRKCRESLVPIAAQELNQK